MHRVSLLSFVLALSACHPTTGDWVVRAATLDGSSVAVQGVIEIDRDGEYLLEISLVPPGPDTLRAEGAGSLEADRLTLDGPATWQDGSGTTTVALAGACSAEGRDLSCTLTIDGAPWTLDAEREGLGD